MLDSAKSHCLGVARVTVLTLALSLQVTCPYVGCGESFADHSTIHAQVGVGVGRQGTALATASWLQPALGLENRAISYCTVAAELLKGQQAQSPTLALSGGWRMG